MAWLAEDPRTGHPARGSLHLPCPPHPSPCQECVPCPQPTVPDRAYGWRRGATLHFSDSRGSLRIGRVMEPGGSSQSPASKSPCACSAPGTLLDFPFASFIQCVHGTRFSLQRASGMMPGRHCWGDAVALQLRGRAVWQLLPRHHPRAVVALALPWGEGSQSSLPAWKAECLLL